MIQKILIGFLIFQTLVLSAQESSTKGWALPVEDTLRVLMIFVEVDYDIEPDLEVLPLGRDAWKPGELPEYADDIFDVFSHENPEGTMTKYYTESSLGNFLVLGDYLPDLYRVKWSSLGDGGVTSLLRELTNQLKNDTSLKSNSGLELKDFDIWERSEGWGAPKKKSGDEFEGVDHVMVFTRNFHKLPRDNGQASGGSMGFVNGKRIGSYSIFAGGYSFPFGILRHELNHLFIGGNNLHCCGGNAPGFQSYFPFVQGGWGMMGGANSSFLTCSGWDRYWLGWQKPENDFLISARNEDGREVNGDINRENGTGIYVLRDFAIDGDALRIKLPFIPESEHQQWLWIENHMTKLLTGSEFDVFQYEHHDCISEARAGLYMHVQVDADKREGTGIYGKVKADYLRPVLADGNYDFKWDDAPKLLSHCVNSTAYIPYYYDPKFENPLTGNHAQEFPQYYTDADVELNEKTARSPSTRRIGSAYERLPLLGNPRHGFRTGEKTNIGVGTNPSSANMLTLVNSRKPGRVHETDNRKIYINGLHIEILRTLPDASVVVEVRFDDNVINDKRRWCAPEIVLGNHIPNAPDLIVKSDLKLDMGETITRFDKPDTVNGKAYFTDPTRLIVKPYAELVVEGSITLTGKSKLIIEPGGILTINKKAKIYVENGSELILENNAKISGKGKVKIRKTGIMKLEDTGNDKALKKMVRGKKRMHRTD